MDKIRSEVDDSYKWDIDNMIPEGKKLEKIYEEIDELCNKILSYKGTILDSSTNLINVLNYSNQLDRCFTVSSCVCKGRFQIPNG